MPLSNEEMVILRSWPGFSEREAANAGTFDFGKSNYGRTCCAACRGEFGWMIPPLFTTGLRDGSEIRKLERELTSTL